RQLILARTFQLLALEIPPFRDPVLPELGQLLSSAGVVGIEPLIRCLEILPPAGQRSLRSSIPTLSSILDSPI
ncbi:MAG TPA: hypothetical protein VMR88_07415, partial [Candidatus Polarisedimenticolaceae bacterium]|nr:hypothetical protein [Candidatus Polarisedimenticolaceae bacterium]